MMSATANVSYMLTLCAVALCAGLTPERPVEIHRTGNVADDKLAPRGGVDGLESVQPAKERERRDENVRETRVALAERVAGDAPVLCDQGDQDWLSCQRHWQAVLVLALVLTLHHAVDVHALERILHHEDLERGQRRVDVRVVPRVCAECAWASANLQPSTSNLQPPTSSLQRPYLPASCSTLSSLRRSTHRPRHPSNS
jgi:hypothetical protein